MTHEILDLSAGGFRAGHGGHCRRRHLRAKIINKDSNGTWNFQPDKPKAKYFKAEGMPGGYAFRVKATKGVNPWDVQASSPVAGRHQRRRRDHAACTTRAPRNPPKAAARSPRASSSPAPPYTSVLDMTRRSSGEWKSYCAHPRRQRDACRKRRATCRSTSPPPSRSSSSGRCSCSISARATTEEAQVLRWLRSARTDPGRRCASCASRSRRPRNSNRTVRLTIVPRGAQGQGVRHVRAQSPRRRARGPVAQHAGAGAVAAARIVAEPHLQAAVRRALAAGSASSSTRAFPGSG